MQTDNAGSLLPLTGSELMDARLLYDYARQTKNLEHDFALGLITATEIRAKVKILVEQTKKIIARIKI